MADGRAGRGRFTRHRDVIATEVLATEVTIEVGTPADGVEVADERVGVTIEVA